MRSRLRALRVAVPLVTISFLVALARPALAQSADTTPPQVAAPLEVRRERMRLTLDHAADQNSSHVLGGTIYTLLGGALVGLGAGFALEDKAKTDGSLARGVAVVGSVALGSYYLADGIHLIASGPTPEVLRWRRFQAAQQANAVDEVMLARFEGELSAEAEAAANRRRARGWVGVGLAAGGAGLVTLAATSHLKDEARHFSYAEGSVWLIAGTLESIWAFASTSSAEKNWNAYRDGMVPPAQSARFSIAPVVGPSSAFISATAAF